jgi:hypothetical protein
MSGNHRGGRSLVVSSLFIRVEVACRGTFSTRIDFQLGTNGDNANSVALALEGAVRKNLLAKRRSSFQQAFAARQCGVRMTEEPLQGMAVCACYSEP